MRYTTLVKNAVTRYLYSPLVHRRKSLPPVEFPRDPGFMFPRARAIGLFKMQKLSRPVARSNAVLAYSDFYGYRKNGAFHSLSLRELQAHRIEAKSHRQRRLLLRHGVS